MTHWVRYEAAIMNWNFTAWQPFSIYPIHKICNQKRRISRSIVGNQAPVGAPYQSCHQAPCNTLCLIAVLDVFQRPISCAYIDNEEILR